MINPTSQSFPERTHTSLSLAEVKPTSLDCPAQHPACSPSRKALMNKCVYSLVLLPAHSFCFLFVDKGVADQLPAPASLLPCHEGKLRQKMESGMGCGSKNLTVLYLGGIREILKVCLKVCTRQPIEFCKQSFRGISVRAWKTATLRATWAEEASLMGF